MPYNLPPSHIPFILRPATDTIKEAISAINATRGGIETYPLCGYFMPSLFLKLTGSQEQKLKCICWEMACRDYEYRYERYEKRRYGECSDYSDKCMVYNDLINEIKKVNEAYMISDIEKDQLIIDWKKEFIELFENSLIANSFRKQYDDFQAITASINKQWIMNGSQLLSKTENISSTETAITCGLGLQEIFVKYVYAERNRCAHNTRSYQHNIPSLKGMTAVDYKLQNYFLFMSVILLIDMIFTKLFKTYLDIIK